MKMTYSKRWLALRDRAVRHVGRLAQLVSYPIFKHSTLEVVATSVVTRNWLHVLALALVFPLLTAQTAFSAPLPPSYYLFTFETLSLDEQFTTTHQPYESDSWGRGITIMASPTGQPTVVLNPYGSKVLKNVGESEFGTSEYSDLHIDLVGGLLADQIDVEVGLLAEDAFPVTAHLQAFYLGSLGDSDTVDLGVGPTTASMPVLSVEAGANPIDRIIVSYGYTGGGTSSAMQSEVVDDISISVYEEEPPPPPVDDTPPDMRILDPDLGGPGTLECTRVR